MILDHRRARKYRLYAKQFLQRPKLASRSDKDARLKQGLTQVELAEKAGMHPNSYAKIERGESEPSIESLRRLIKALKIDLSKIPYLLG